MTVNYEDKNHSEHPLSNNLPHSEREEATKSENTSLNDFSNSDVCNDRRQDVILRDKEFLPRNSPLIDLYHEDQLFKMIYNIIIASVIIMFMSSAITEFVETGTVLLGVQTIIIGFGKMPIAIYIWIGMTASTFLLYSIFAFWAHKRLNFQTKSYSLKILDYGALISFILYQIAFIIFPTKFVFEEDLPPATSLIVVMEQVRMLMKSHAFVRSNTPRVLKFKEQSEKEGILCPVFGKFLYFMFVPMIVYRDNYPRTKEIRWKFVAWHFSQVILVIFYLALVCERFLVPAFKQFGNHPVNFEIIVYNLFNNMTPGILFYLSGFYSFQHSWMNGFAELLRFADRMFYNDWWYASSLKTYYRTWNNIVHDWLYTYIYKDMYEIVTPKCKLLSTITVILVSSLFHEYIIAVGFRFFCPIMILQFGVLGSFFTLIPKKNLKPYGNIFMWWTHCTGSSIFLNLYAMEFYARINCAPNDNKILDFFIPRSWFCQNV